MRPRLVFLVLGGAVGALSYRLLRQPILTWGATPAEAASRLPGDEFLEQANGVSTRAIEIDAPAVDVWPWLAQMGPSPRGGAYTYDWIENLLGLNMHSADSVLEDFQHPEIGDTISFGSMRMRVERVEPQRVFTWRSEDGNWVWTFVLEEHDGRTRLMSRNRFRLPTLAARIGMLPMEPGSLVMEWRMLRGIKQRAERLACPPPSHSDSNAALLGSVEDRAKRVRSDPSAWPRGLPFVVVAWRTAHALIAVGFLWSITYVWWCALSGRRGPSLRLALGALVVEGVLVGANKGDCPLAGVGDRIGDPVPLFELILPPRAARRAVPVLGMVTAAGIALLVVRGNRLCRPSL